MDATETEIRNFGQAMIIPISRLLIACLLPLVIAGAGMAQEIATAVDVRPQADVQSASGKSRLARGAMVSVGDTIVTGRSGQVHLEFTDGTRMVVGPRSSLLVEEYLMTNRSTATRFSVNALGGTFRFISGNSPKSAYKIRTPSATLGIRGTKFDMNIRPDGTVGVAIMEGATQLCGNDRCIVLQDSCSVGVNYINRRMRKIDDEEDRNVALFRNFPYLENQRGLRRGYRVDVSSCGDQFQAQIHQRRLERSSPIFNPLGQGNTGEGNPADPGPGPGNPNPGDPT